MPRAINSPEQMRQRTKAFALRIIRLVQALPKTNEAQIIGRRLLRSSTSVGANYRSACRGRSRSEFISKLGIGLEEADETICWLELLVEANVIASARMADLLDEANQLTAIFSATRRSVRTNHQSQITNRKSQVSNG